MNPQIYVACLAAYNNGKLHGEWIDAAQDPEDILEEIQEMLSKSPEPDAEEWAIHDYDDFDEISIGEHESLETISIIASALEEYGEPMAYYIANLADYIDDELIDNFEEAYHGEWNSEEDYARTWYEDSGMLDHNSPLSNYIDWEAVARDMSCECMHFAKAGSFIWAFWTCGQEGTDKDGNCTRKWTAI